MCVEGIFKDFIIIMTLSLSCIYGDRSTHSKLNQVIPSFSREGMVYLAPIVGQSIEGFTCYLRDRQ